MQISRSMLSDAFTGGHNTLVKALGRLIDQTRSQLPDKLAGVDGLGDRAVIAIDATPSSHYDPVSHPHKAVATTEKTINT